MTYSIVGRCEKTRELGVCVASAVPTVGSIVPYVEANVGAVATQATSSACYGTNGLQLVRLGLSPKSVLEALLLEDDKIEHRQVTIIDAKGRTAGFTGKQTIQWSGHHQGNNCVAAGNTLAGQSVIPAMTTAFESAEGPLEGRLMVALEAGQEAGGDKRGRRGSAAILVRKRFTEKETRRPSVDIRVDEHPDPVPELRRILEIWKDRYSPSSPSFNYDYHRRRV